MKILLAIFLLVISSLAQEIKRVKVDATRVWYVCSEAANLFVRKCYYVGGIYGIYYPKLEDRSEACLTFFKSIPVSYYSLLGDNLKEARQTARFVCMSYCLRILKKHPDDTFIDVLMLCEELNNKKGIPVESLELLEKIKVENLKKPR